MPDTVTDQVADALPGLIELRRDLHANPELGFYETRTAGIIADRLNAAGLNIQAEVGGTGVVGVLDTGKAGPTLMIRADIDALPVSELSDLPFCLLYTSPSPRDGLLSRMPSSA